MALPLALAFFLAEIADSASRSDDDGGAALGVAGAFAAAGDERPDADMLIVNEVVESEARAQSQNSWTKLVTAF